MQTIPGRLGSAVIAAAVAIGILALVIPLFLNPVWVAFEQGRAQATAWTGFTETELRAATDSILADLVFGPADFDVVVADAPVLNAREQGHMRDVRGVFFGFFALAIGLGIAALLIAARRRGAARVASWRAVRTGAVALIAFLGAAGIVSFIAFDTLFEVFHRLFFAGGSYTFDPATERLVQLFPFAFWQESAIAVGIVAIVVAIAVAVVAERRAGRLAAVSAASGGARATAEPASPAA